MLHPTSFSELLEFFGTQQFSQRIRRVHGAIVLVEGQPRNVPTAVLVLLGAA